MSNDPLPDWYTQALKQFAESQMLQKYAGPYSQTATQIAVQHAQQTLAQQQAQAQYNVYRDLLRPGVSGNDLNPYYNPAPQFDPTWRARYELALIEARNMRFAGEL